MRLHLVFATALFSASAQAQSHADTLAGNQSPAAVKWSAGVSTGMMRFGDGGRERAVSGTVGLSLPYGFGLSVSPTFAWAQAAPSVDAATGRLVSAPLVNGLADLPVGISYSHSLPGPGSPGFWLGLSAVLPTGDTTTVGSGETSYGADVSLWADVGGGFSASAGAGHSLANDWASGLGSIAPTTVSLGLSRAMGRASVNADYSTEVGAMPTGTSHSQNFGAGATLPLRGDLGLVVNGSVGRADGASSWALSVGLGTAFAGVASVTPRNALSALANALGAGRSMGNSRSAAAKAAAAARKIAKAKRTRV